MKKGYLIIAAIASVALVSCSNEEFVGELDPGTGTVNQGQITFGTFTPRITRAEGAAAAAEKLGYKFKVYATKTVNDGTNDVISNVFATNQYASGADYNASPYWVWYDDNTALTTTSNTKDWEYVGSGGNSGADFGTDNYKVHFNVNENQTIKYWDYSASKYEFVAYSATVDGATITKYQKDGFTITATAAQLAGLYIADKVTLKSNVAEQVDNNPTKPASDYNKIGDIVKFTFRNAATKVRLGIYETIPGYVVRNVNFRPNASEFTATTAKATLSGSFNGTSSSASGTYNVTYNATTGVAEFANTAASASNYFDFGSFVENTAIGETSTAPTWATGSADYQGVFPNTDHVGNMTLYVDYQLYNATSGETINVKGAKAVVPAMYMKWNPNYAYTYLFKISDNTNGTTSASGTDPVGLYPITFDAVTIAATDGQEVGTITSVTTPAITTYQNGSVSASGITYANANGDIYITVNTAGTLETLTDKIKLYTVDAGTTEADLMLTTKDKTESNLLTIGTGETLQGISFTSGQYAKFTPESPAANSVITYAVQYTVSAEVPEAYTAATVTANEDIPANTYYEQSGESPNYHYTLTTDTKFANKTYYTKTPAVPAVYQYKIIIVK